MQKTFCDKCKKEGANNELVCPQAALLDSRDRHYGIKRLDLCDECRLELKEVLYKWLYV